MIPTSQKTLKHITLFTLTCIFAFGLISCSENPSNNNQSTPDFSSTTPEIPEICGILSDNEVKKILGGDFEPMTLSLASDETIGCKYVEKTTEETENKVIKSFNFISNVLPSETVTKNEYYKGVNVWLNTALANIETQNIDGVGTMAFLAGNRKTQQLLTYKENKLIILTFGDFELENDSLLGIAKPLAVKLLDRI